MTQIDTVFATKIYRAALKGRGVRTLNEQLKSACIVISEDDQAGQAWSVAKGYRGYTSYSSLADLPWRSPEFRELQDHLDTHVSAFIRDLDFDLGGRPLELDSIWINILEPGGAHTAHIHPHSVISGTYYVDIPDGAGAIRFEDPRLAMMMAAPPRKARARAENRTFTSIQPRPGMVLLWESWLRHEVPQNDGREPRISISFNYGLPS